QRPHPYVVGVARGMADGILDEKRDAPQGTTVRVAGGCLGSGLLEAGRDDRVDPGVDPLDPGNCRLHQIERTARASTNKLSLRGGVEMREIGVHSTMVR